MKRLLLTVLVLVLTFSACSKERAALHVYTWSDYIKPELLNRFESENACEVVVDTFDANESMYAKLKAGATGYDVVTPSSYMAKAMWAQGMLQPIKKEVVPNASHVDKNYLKIAMDKEMRYSVPYMLTVTGVAYLKGRVPKAEPTWAMFDRPEFRGRMTMLNDMRETIGAALKYLGYSLNTTDEKQLAAARDVVIRWKKNLAKFENEQYKTGLASAEFLVVHGYSGDILQVQGENQEVEFMIPREGTSIACDDLVIPKQAKAVDLAHRFINFLHDPKVAAENTEFIAYLCPNQASYEYLKPELRQNPALFPPGEVTEKAEVIDDLGPANALYTKTWDEIKAAP